MDYQLPNAAIRQLLYQAASVAFAPPTSQLVEDLHSGTFTDVLRAIASQHELNLEHDIQSLEIQVHNHSRTLLEDLQAEYVHLFVSNAHTLPAPPYGSYYLDEVLMGKHFENVLKAYASSGFTLSLDYHDLADHISAELEFLWYLSHTQERRSFQLSLAFLEQHLLSWLPRFTDCVQQAAQHPFYRTMAIWTQRAIAADTAWLKQRSEVQRWTNCADVNFSNSPPAR